MNLLQYRPAAVVQAAPIIGVDIASGVVTVHDVDHRPVQITVGHVEGMRIGMTLIIWEEGANKANRYQAIDTDVFDAEWNPVGGPVLL